MTDYEIIQLAEEQSSEYLSAERKEFCLNFARALLAASEASAEPIYQMQLRGSDWADVEKRTFDDLPRIRRRIVYAGASSVADAAGAIKAKSMREGFEAQRQAGINVDWFTWQIAWNDAAIAKESGK